MCDSKNSFYLSCGMISDSHISGKFACKSFMTMYLFCLFFMSTFPNNFVQGCPTTTATKNTDIMMYHTIKKEYLAWKKEPVEDYEIENFGTRLAINRYFHQLAKTYNFGKQVSNTQAEIYIYHAFILFLKILFIDFFIVNFIGNQ